MRRISGEKSRRVGGWQGCGGWFLFCSVEGPRLRTRRNPKIRKLVPKDFGFGRLGRGFAIKDREEPKLVNTRFCQVRVKRRGAASSTPSPAG